MSHPTDPSYCINWPWTRCRHFQPNPLHSAPSTEHSLIPDSLDKDLDPQPFVLVLHHIKLNLSTPRVPTSLKSARGYIHGGFLIRTFLPRASKSGHCTHDIVDTGTPVCRNRSDTTRQDVFRQPQEGGGRRDAVKGARQDNQGRREADGKGGQVASAR